MKEGGQTVVSPGDIDLLSIPQISPKSKASLLIDTLGDLVIKGHAEPGDRIPPERQLAEQAGVSRAIVREALSALHLAGLVDRREGSGNFFADVRNAAILKSRALSLVGRDQDPYVVLAARAAFEPCMAELLLENVTADDLESLTSVHEKLQVALSEEAWDSYFEADSSFHMGLASATHNPCISRMEEYLTSKMFSALWRDISITYYITEPASIGISRRCHAGILEALKASDLEGLRESLDRHSLQLRLVLESKMGDEGSGGSN